jgi:tyrosine-protein kinase
VDLRRLTALFRSWLPIMVVAVALAGGAGYVASSLQAKVYEAQSTLIVGQALSAPNPDYTQLLVAQNLSATYATIAHTSPMLQKVIDDLKLNVTPQDLSGRIRVTAPPDSTTLMITAQDGDPARAADIANSLSEVLIAASPTIGGRAEAFQKSIDQGLSATQALIESTQARVDTLLATENRTPDEDTELQTLEGRLTTLRSSYATLLGFSSGAATNLLTLIDPAIPATSPVLPRTLLNTLLAAALGLLVVIGVAFVVDQLDDSVKDRAAVQSVTGLTTLGTIGRMRSLPGRQEFYQLAGILYPRSSITESYRTLRTNVEFASLDAPLRTLLVTSATPQEGKTVTSGNLAVVFAQAGRSVLLVDADLRRPGVGALFGLTNTTGLTTLLRGEATSVDRVAHATEQANLRIVTTGPLPPNPAELLGSTRMQAVLNLLKESAEIVIFDSPPLQPVTDAAVLSSFVDGTLLVIDAKRSHRKFVALAREALDHAGGHTLGAVLNRVEGSADLAYDGYYGLGGKPPDTSANAVTDPGGTA